VLAEKNGEELRACLVKVKVMMVSYPISYEKALSDTEWIRLRSYLPTPKAQGRPRPHALRDIFDAIFYVLKSNTLK
jgi:hypothetical protein